jgi:steroid 5-alpha reductase family enzyme
MRMPLELLGQTLLGVAVVVFAYMTAWFAVALIVRRNDLADLAWGIGFITVALWLLLRQGSPLSMRQCVVSALVLVWGTRLAWHIGRRNLRPGHAEDARYAKWRREWGGWFVPRTYLQVFLLQGVFMTLISMPVLVVGTAGGPEFGWLDICGVAVWLVGFVFESVGDAQLARFLGDKANRGHVMDRGLWAWTRHPNYFGESTMWWGLALVALSVPGGWPALVGPVTITWLLTKVSGIPLVEAQFAGQPEWEAYKASTSAFIPLPPRRG